MNLLLDTHALIWFLEDDARLSPNASAAMSQPENRCFFSDATAWEMGIKLSLGKLKLPLAFETLFPERLDAEGFRSLPIRHPHLHRLMKLNWHHRDPFDRLLIAQAFVEGMMLVSRVRVLLNMVWRLSGSRQTPDLTRLAYSHEIAFPVTKV